MKRFYSTLSLASLLGIASCAVTFSNPIRLGMVSRCAAHIRARTALEGECVLVDEDYGRYGATGPAIRSAILNAGGFVVEVVPSGRQCLRLRASTTNNGGYGSSARAFVEFYRDDQLLYVGEGVGFYSDYAFSTQVAVQDAFSNLCARVP